MITSTKIVSMDLLEKSNKEIQLDVLGPLPSTCGANKYLLICVDRFLKFPTNQITTRTTATVIKEFLDI